MRGEIIVRGPIVSADVVDERWLAAHRRPRRVRRAWPAAIIGRTSDTIVTGGENVAPAEVEAALLEHPDVADAGVHARPDEEWGEVVVAKVVPRARRGRVSRRRLREFCAGRIARYKVPKSIELVAELPRTGSGKLLRRELR